MGKVFYGAGKLPKGKRRPTMSEAVNKNQIRYWGVNKIDSRILNKAAKTDSKDKLLVKKVKLKARIQRMLKNAAAEKDPVKKAKLREDAKKVAVEFKKVIADLKTVENAEIRAGKALKKKIDKEIKTMETVNKNFDKELKQIEGKISKTQKALAKQRKGFKKKDKTVAQLVREFNKLKSKEAKARKKREIEKVMATKKPAKKPAKKATKKATKKPAKKPAKKATKKPAKKATKKATKKPAKKLSKSEVEEIYNKYWDTVLVIQSVLERYAEKKTKKDEDKLKKKGKKAERLYDIIVENQKFLNTRQKKKIIELHIAERANIVYNSKKDATEAIKLWFIREFIDGSAKKVTEKKLNSAFDGYVGEASDYATALEEIQRNGISDEYREVREEDPDIDQDGWLEEKQRRYETGKELISLGNLQVPEKYGTRTLRKDLQEADANVKRYQ